MPTIEEQFKSSAEKYTMEDRFRMSAGRTNNIAQQFQQSAFTQLTSDVQGNPIGFVEAFTQDPQKFVPFFGSLMQASEMANVFAAAKRIEGNNYDEAPPGFLSGGTVGMPGQWAPWPKPWSSKKQRTTDLEAVTNWWNTIQERQERGYTGGGVVGSIVGEMPAFMSEFIMTGGLAKAGEKITVEALEKFVKGRMSRKVGQKLLGKFAKAGVRTPLLMNRVASAYAENRLPKNIGLKDGELSFEWPKDNPFTSFVKAYGDTFIEAFSEELGDFMKLPFGKKLSAKLFKQLKIKHPKLTKLQYLKRMSTRAGFHGVVGELGEEFTGDALRAVTNIQDFGADKIAQEKHNRDADIFERLGAALENDWNNLPAMAAAFAIPGVVKGGAGAALIGLENVAGEPFSIDDIVSRAEAEETVDEKMQVAKNQYIKTGVKESLEVERGPETRVIQTPEGLEPAPTFEVPEVREEVPTIDDQVPNEVIIQAQTFMDEGMPADKAFQWAQKMNPERPKAPAPEVSPTAREKAEFEVPKRKRIDVIRRKTQQTVAGVLKAAKQMSDETGMPIAEAVDFVRRIRGETEAAAQPGDILKAQLGKRNSAILRIASGSKEVFNEVTAYVESTGGLVSDSRMRETQLNALRLMAAERRKQKTRQDKANLHDKSVNILSGFQTARYALSKLELAAGFPLRAMYRKMNIKHNETRTRIENLIRGVYNTIGESPESLDITAEQNENIKRWLFSKDKAAYTALPKNLKALADQLHGLLQGEGARSVKSIRWKYWKKYGVVPAGIPKDINPNTILEAGKLAEQEGTFNQWLDSQSWGARETYYMSEGFESASDLLESLLQPGTFSENASRAPGALPGEAKTRKAAKTYKKGLVLNNVHTHLTRLALADALMDDLDVFWSGFINAKPSKQDVSNMKLYLTHILGKSLPGGSVTNIVRKARSAFWNLYFVDPFKSAYFFFRNSLQNIAYLPSQISTTEAFKSSANLVKEWKKSSQDIERVNDFDEVWESDINQKKKIYQEAMLAKEETTPFEKHNKKLVGLALRASDKLASWALTSDTMNRTMAWHTFYDAAQRNFGEFNNGNISFKILKNRLKLDTLNVTQVNELLQELDWGNTRTATKLYASYKTENTHFRYETTLRSAAEQSPLSRAILGLVVYPRGVFNISYENGYRPLVQGLKVGDYDKAYQALGAILSLLIAASFARAILKKVTGKESYGIPSYTPIDPGLSMISNMLDEVRQVESKGPARTLKVLAANLEFAIPLADEMTNMYESQNDKAGVRFWQIVLIGLKSEYKRKYKKQWKKNNRSDWEKISHVLFSGGYEQEEDE